MSRTKKTSLFKSPYFWIITISLIISLLIIFASHYLFESFSSLTLRLLVSFIIFFGTLLILLMYKLFVKEEVKEKIWDLRKKFKRQKEYSAAIEKKIQDLKTSFNEAMRIVKSSSMYKNKQIAGYELPWYLMVGAETEGKTALLETSGLDFPLNINYDKRTVTDKDSTQSFQWYFAEHAIFVDMPGNYISSENSEESLALWQAFLRLFGKKRWKRPINGVILTISVDTLINKNEKELEDYAKDLRNRFDEISNAFKSKIPIYLLVTKTDKIEGFKEYFSSINEDEKAEILGVTFDDQEESIDTSIIQPELESLLERLNSSILDKVHKEWDNDSRSKTLLFCHEFSVLFEKLNMFAEIGFAQTRYRKPLMLRGIYFTSAQNQQNLPMTQEFEQNTVAKTVSKKGMFIQKVLTNVIFPESDIIAMDTNYKRKYRTRNIAALAVSIILAIGITIYWVQDFNSRLNTLDSIEKNMANYIKVHKTISSEADFKEALVSLNNIYEIKKISEKHRANDFWRIAYFKIDERNKTIEEHYKKALQTILLPRVANLLEEQIIANIGDYDLTWESTKAYVMLNNQKRMDKEFLKVWMATGWSHIYPNLTKTQNDLNMHFDNLLAYGFAPYRLNEDTLALSRKHLLEVGQEALVYKELKNIAAERNLENFQFSRSLGSYASAFEGSDYIIPGFYTKQGYKSIIIGEGKGLVRKLVENNWVVGYSTDLSEAELDELYAKVQNYYFEDYKKYWVIALNRLIIPNYKSISELNNQLTTLTSGTSPIIGVLKSLKENTMIYTPAEELQIKAQKTLKNGNAVTSIASKDAIEKAKKITDNTSVKNIRDYFTVYHTLLDENSRPTSKLATAMSKLNTVYQEMTSIYGSVTPENDAYTIVIDRISGRHEPIVMQISPLPRPVDKWFKKALTNDWQYLLTQTKKHINAQFNIEVLGFYHDKLRGRYPLFKKSRKHDSKLEDFEEFFKKDGVLDSFYKRYISSFVTLNTRSRSYKFKRIDGSRMNIKSKFMNSMIIAEDIRKAFFNSKGEYLSSTIYFKPHALGRKLAQMEFNYDNNYISYEHGPIKSKKVIWPQKNDSDVVFSMYDLNRNKVVSESKSGEWGFFKLIDKFNVKNAAYKQGAFSAVIKYKKDEYDGSFTLTGPAVKTFTDSNPIRYFSLSSGL